MKNNRYQYRIKMRGLPPTVCDVMDDVALATRHVIKIQRPARLSFSIKASENRWQRLSCSSKALKVRSFIKSRNAVLIRSSFSTSFPIRRICQSPSLPARNSPDPHTSFFGCKFTMPAPVFFYYYDHYYLFAVPSSPFFSPKRELLKGLQRIES